MSQSEFVRYIDKTRAYYRREGYTRDYRWAHHTEAPFAAPIKPLAQSRAMLISTASLALLDEDGHALDAMPIIGTQALEVFPVPSDLPEDRILYVVGNHDRAQSDMSDVNSYFPIGRLREFAAEGVLGSLATDFFRLKENYSQRKTLEVDAPEVLRRCREDKVDVALLTPV